MNVKKILLVALFLLGLSGASAKEDALDGPVPALVTAVIDGDTLQVRARIWLGHEVTTRVRLAGIDAPEARGRCPQEKRLAAEARAFVAGELGLMDERPVVVQLMDIRYGKFAGRVLARVELNGGEDLGGALLAAGLARRYDGRRRPSWCEDAALN